MVTESELEAIGRTLVDPGQPLQARFRALFTLRGLGGPGAISWISQAFGDDSALLKHELAYCLGQMQDTSAIPVLVAVLQDRAQEPMVRHEAGEWPEGHVSWHGLWPGRSDRCHSRSWPACSVCPLPLQQKWPRAGTPLPLVLCSPEFVLPPLQGRPWELLGTPRSWSC